MPLHLLVMILSRLNNIQTLGSAILSHPLFYAAYKDAPRIVVRSITRRHITSYLMRYAANAYEASRIGRHDKLAVLELQGWDMRPALLKEWLVGWESDPASTSAAVAASLIKTHRAVRYFRRRFFKDTAPFASEIRGPLPPHAEPTEPSPAEWYRVYRALYRFQIYCNLGFRTKQDLQPSPEWAQTFQDARSATMFGKFSPWVNEQLACIHDYLERILSKCTYQLPSRV